MFTMTVKWANERTSIHHSDKLESLKWIIDNYDAIDSAIWQIEDVSGNVIKSSHDKAVSLKLTKAQQKVMDILESDKIIVKYSARGKTRYYYEINDARVSSLTVQRMIHLGLLKQNATGRFRDGSLMSAEIVKA